MKGDWRMKMLAVQGIWLVIFVASDAALYLARPHYSLDAGYPAAHDRWEQMTYLTGGTYLVVSLAITGWFAASRNRSR